MNRTIDKQHKNFLLTLEEQKKEKPKYRFSKKDFLESLKDHPWLIKVYEIIDQGTEFIKEEDGNEVVLLKKLEKAEIKAIEFILEMLKQNGFSILFNQDKSALNHETNTVELNFSKPEKEIKKRDGVPLYTMLSEIIHEAVHAIDFKEKRYDPSNIESREKTERRAYPHTYMPVSEAQYYLANKAHYLIKGLQHSVGVGEQ